MTNDDITVHIEELQRQIMQVASDSVEARDGRARDLFDIALRLRDLVPSPENQASSPTEKISATTSSTIQIFASYGGKPRKAELDTQRISSGGRGKCVLFQGQWMTASGAAGEITGTAVNGWQNFWRFRRQDGSEGPIQELRDRRLRSEVDVTW